MFFKYKTSILFLNYFLTWNEINVFYVKPWNQIWGEWVDLVGVGAS